MSECWFFLGVLPTCLAAAILHLAGCAQTQTQPTLFNLTFIQICSTTEVYFSVENFHIWTPGYFASVRCHIRRCSHFSQWSVIEEGGADIHSAHFFRWWSSSWHSLSDSITNWLLSLTLIHWHHHLCHFVSIVNSCFSQFCKWLSVLERLGGIAKWMQIGNDYSGLWSWATV